jgi:DNA damage-binding protein 1
VSTVLFGTSSGVLGVIASLSQRHYEILDKLQMAMRTVIKGIGGMGYESWRSFTNACTAPIPAHGFIDGDLIEQFLDLKKESVDAVVKELGEGFNEEQILHLVEDLSRLH